MLTFDSICFVYVFVDILFCWCFYVRFVLDYLGCCLCASLFGGFVILFIVWFVLMTLVIVLFSLCWLLLAAYFVIVLVI